MIFLQFGSNRVIVQRPGMKPVKHLSASECIAMLVKNPIIQPITVIYPCAGSIPFSSVEPLTSRLINMLKASLSFLPEWNRPAFEMIAGLLPLIERQPILVAFDDYLYRDLPESVRSYALPYELSQQYPRHGNDGSVHDWAFQQIKGDLKNDPLITIHLQGRPTLSAFRGGKVVDMSTDYSPLDGLPGSTTCGVLDPSLPIMLASSGMAVDDIRTVLCEQSGWQSSPSPEVMRKNSLVKAIGSMAASCHGLKTLFFFGEDLSEVATICERLAVFGLRLMKQKKYDPSALHCLTCNESVIQVFCIQKDYLTILSEFIQSAT